MELQTIVTLHYFKHLFNIFVSSWGKKDFFWHTGKQYLCISFFKHPPMAPHIEASVFWVIKRLLPCLQASSTTSFSVFSLCLTCRLWTVPRHAIHVPPEHPILTKKTLTFGAFKMMILTHNRKKNIPWSQDNFLPCCPVVDAHMAFIRPVVWDPDLWESAK